MNNKETIIPVLDDMWDGPLFNLRSGDFSEENYRKILLALRSINTDCESDDFREITRKIWYIPIFIRENYISWIDKEGSIDKERFNAFSNEVENILMNILGAP